MQHTHTHSHTHTIKTQFHFYICTNKCKIFSPKTAQIIYKDEFSGREVNITEVCCALITLYQFCYITFISKHHHSAALQKFSCKFRSLMKNPEVTMVMMKNSLRRNPERNLTPEKSPPHPSDSAIINHYNVQV